MKNIIIKLLFIFFFISCSGGSEESANFEKEQDPDSNSGKISDSFKKIITDEYNIDAFKLELR